MTVQKTVEFPQLQCSQGGRCPCLCSSSTLMDVAVIMQRRGVRRHLCRGAEANSHGPVQETIEILQLQYIDKVIDAGRAGPASSPGAHVEETAELPQLHPVEALDKVVDTPVVYNDRECGFSARSLTRRCVQRQGSWSRQCSPWTRLLRYARCFHDKCTWFQTCRKRLEVPQMQFCVSWGRPCDHAALMAVFMAIGRLMGFLRISAFFALLRVVLELSASAN